MKTLLLKGKKDAPLYVLPSYEEEEGKEIYRRAKGHLPSFSLLIITSFSWQSALAPFDYLDPFTKKETQGQGEEFLSFILDDLTEAVRESGLTPSYYGLFGYSLAGLFTCYAMFKKTPFTRFGSVSGSLWFPSFLSYAESSPFLSEVKKVYLSFGEKEERSHNEVFKEVGNRTREFQKILEQRKTENLLEINPGGHDTEPVYRQIKALSYLLKKE